jgi:polyisoprenoid-binding protein YceI
MSKKYIIALVIIVILAAAGMYGYSKYSQREAKESVDKYLQNKEANKTETEVKTEESKVLETKPAENATTTSFTGSVNLTPENTKLAWIGRKTLVVGYEDAGKIDIKSGVAKVENGKVTSVSATIDMTTIGVIKSGKGKDEDKLTGHLKSEDFFNVEKYPTAELSITQAKPVSGQNGAQNYEFSGTLTMKGITAEVSVPGVVTISQDAATLLVETKLDRTKWGVNYGSSKLADSFIDDFFTLKVSVNAKLK